MKTFLFYDIETSGLNQAFDQVLTFAFIRTDLKLQELERQTITIRLRKDIFPSPEAFITHGLTYNELESGVCEYDAALKIHKILNTPGTISLGYNSLGFDDEFLRFMFYRNLLDPYVHQYGNGCCRMDILPVATVFRVFHPEVLTWPEIDGKPSLKLEWISQLNEFETSGRAHEAMNDVEALLALSMKLSQKQEIWRYCLDFFNKTRDEVRIKSFDTSVEIGGQHYLSGIMVSSSFGSDNNYLTPVIRIGQSKTYKNQELWMRLDADDILGLKENLSIEDTYVTRKRYGDIPIVLPMLDRFVDKMSETAKTMCRENIAKLNENSDKFIKFVDYHCQYKYPHVPGMDLDASLYQDGFFSGSEKKESHMFHEASKGQKTKILDQIKSPRIKQLANRIIVRNFQADVEATDEFDHRKFFAQVGYDCEPDQIIGYKNDIKLDGGMALKQLQELKDKLKSPDQDQVAMLDWLGEYLNRMQD